jgi:hypothetical protein
MDSERTSKILNEAYETLRRTEGIPRSEPNRSRVQQIIDDLPPTRTRSGAFQLRYRVQDNGGVAMLYQQPQQQEEQQDWSAWNNWCNTLIKAALEQQQAVLIEAVGQALGEERRTHREAFQKALAKVERGYKKRLMELEAEVTLLRSINKGNIRKMDTT